MVLRVANACALVIDLLRPQLGLVIYNLYHGLQLELTRMTVQFSDNCQCTVFRVSTTISCTLPFYFFLECYRWVMDFKATAWHKVLIAQFGEYFDSALWWL